MKEFFQKNWFRVLALLLLLGIFIRLGEVSNRVFQNTDVSDSNLSAIRNSVLDIEDHVSDIKDLTAEIDDSLYKP